MLDARFIARTRRKIASHKLDLALTLGVFALSLVLYLLTLAPDVAGDDAGEFQFVTYVLGIAHPPGYPLYTLLGKVFSMLPFGPVAYRVNAMSAFFGAATLSLIYVASIQVCEWGNTQLKPQPFRVAGSRLAALCGAAALAAAPTWWYMSTVAAVRTLNGFFVALCVALAIRWSITRDARWLDWLALAFGFSLAHHISMWALAPAFFMFVLVVDWHVLITPQRLLGIAWRVAVPLLINLYLPIRSAMGTVFDPAKPTTLNSFLDLVLAREFSHGVLLFGWSDVPERLYVFNEILIAQFGWVALALAMLGVLGGLVKTRRVMLLIGLIGIANAIVAVSYRDIHTSEYLIPSYLMVAIFVALGVSVLSFGPAQILTRLTARGQYLGLAVAALALLVPWQRLTTNFDGLNRSADFEMRNFASRSLQVADMKSSILTDWHDAPALWYMQLAEGQRRDVNVVYTSAEFHTVPLTESIRTLLGSGSVYLTKYDQDVAANFSLRPVGPLLQVLNGPDLTEPGETGAGNYTEVRANLDNKVMLLGYQVYSDKLSPGETLRVTLFWKALAKMDTSYKVFVHLLSADGNRWGQSDSFPARGFRPTSSWQPGEIIADERELAIMADAPPGQYEILLGMYEVPAPGQWRRLPVVGGNSSSGQDTVSLRKVTMLDKSEQVAQAQFKSDYIVGDSAKLVGYDVYRWNGKSLELGLYWKVLRTTTDDLSVDLRFKDGAGRSLGRNKSRPVDGHYPTNSWMPGQVILDRHEVMLETEPTGDLQMQVGLAMNDTSIAQEKEVAAGESSLPLLNIPRSLNDPGRLRINLGNQILLTAWQLESKQINPGEEVRVHLVWEPVARIPDEASVFVHIVGKDGRKWAQQDGAPVAGSYSTAGWVKGMKINDLHVLKIPSDIPPGEYTIEIGFYLQKSGEKWLVLDRKLALSGQGERVILGSVLVKGK